MQKSTARLLFGLVSLCTAYFGVTYLARAFLGDGWAAAYHQHLAAPLTFDGLGAPVAHLYATLIAVIGSLYLATSLTTAVLATAVTSPAGSAPAWWALLTLNGIGLLLLTIVNLRNGLTSPWWLNLIVLLVVAVALGLTRAPQPADGRSS